MTAPDLETGVDPGVLRQRFLLGMSHAACTVNVVTTDGAAGRQGVTVSAMVSVSAEMPHPTLLVCIHHLSPVADALLLNGVFCVNVLRDDQAMISESFAGRSGAAGLDKFHCAEWTTQVTGAPRVRDALVAFDCRVTASHRVGSHFVVFGSVQDIVIAGGGAPLIYANRAYGVPQRIGPRHGVERGIEPSTQRSDEIPAAALSLGCFKTFAPYIVPALVARLVKLHPTLALSLMEADQPQLVASLRRREIELAMLYDFDLGHEFQIEPLAHLVPYVLLPEAHPLADQAALSLQSLAQEPWVLLDLDPSRGYFMSLFRDHGLEPRVAYRSGSLEMVRGLVAHGLGYGLLATKPANNMSYDGRALVVRPLSDTVRSSRLVLATPAGDVPSAVVTEFIAHCRAFFHGARHAHPNS